MTDEFTQARINRGDCCPVCAKVTCPGRGLLMACQRLWGNPDIQRIQYHLSAEGEQTISVEFDRSMTDLEYDDSEDEPSEAG